MSGKRGCGSCPKCKTNYFNRYKPTLCPSCNYAIGGSYVPKEKKPKLSILPATIVCENVTSVSTTNRNDRCFVSRSKEGLWICLQESCKQRRAVALNSNCTQFSCEHINKAVDQLSQPKSQHRISAEQLISYPCSNAVRDTIRENLEDLSVRYDCAPVVEVSDTVFAVYATATASNPLGFCHVKRSSNPSSITCCGKDCRGIMSKAKQERVQALCIHIHTLLCALTSTPPLSTAVSDESEESTSASLEDTNEEPPERVTTEAGCIQRESTLKV